MTLRDHVHELRLRAFLAGAAIAAGSVVAYIYNDFFSELFLQPLQGQRLVFTNPAGGVQFVLGLSFYIGVLVGLPIIFWQILAFIKPAMPASYSKKATWYGFCSLVLALMGMAVAFVYVIPAALRFLLNFDDGRVEALLSTDTYVSFIAVYLIGFAVAFQLPLAVLLYDHMRPIHLRKFMFMQRYIVLVSFIIGAVVTPTPDPVNQAFLAIPIIALYNIGILLVFIRRHSNSRN